MKKGTVYDWRRPIEMVWRDSDGTVLPPNPKGNGSIVFESEKKPETPSPRDQFFALLNMANTVDYE